MGKKKTPFQPAEVTYTCADCGKVYDGKYPAVYWRKYWWCYDCFKYTFPAPGKYIPSTIMTQE